jgi:hypothetical protein
LLTLHLDRAELGSLGTLSRTQVGSSHVVERHGATKALRHFQAKRTDVFSVSWLDSVAFGRIEGKRTSPQRLTVHDRPRRLSFFRLFVVGVGILVADDRAVLHGSILHQDVLRMFVEIVERRSRCRRVALGGAVHLFHLEHLGQVLLSGAFKVAHREVQEAHHNILQLLQLPDAHTERLSLDQHVLRAVLAPGWFLQRIAFGE